MDGLLFVHDEQANAPAARPGREPNGDRRELERFARSNVRDQRQEGFVTVEVAIPRGDLTPEQFRGLARIMREFSGGYARTTLGQNLVLRWVRRESLYEVWSELVQLDLGDAGAREVTDVVSCPGTDSCKLGITSSMGLNLALRERFAQLRLDDELTRKVHINMSGCPNGCSQHHVANIGFYGASIKVGDRTIPAYIPHVGGNFEHGQVRMGARLKSRLPAKRVPEAVQRWLEHYREERLEGEEFNAFVDRVTPSRFEEIVKDLSMPIEFGLETMNQFIDWSRDVPFQVVRGEGECAI
jgi:sulfite reductase beta subunit-like hemoprotein